MTKQSKINEKWVRCRADELAIDAGCWFDEARARHVCEFFPRFLTFYEGEQAGQPFELLPWQQELLSRVFGWVKQSAAFGRPVRRFRKASIWVPKKNGKSPTAAGVGLYLLIADGEKGQKVYSAAKDGRQAQIVHNHARKMVELSPELRSVCKINRSTGRITHEPSSSWYDVIAGDNIHGQEGLNGSVVIDETHVVDDRLAKVLEYAGASRPEPLQFEVSTAGSNPEGYGKHQYDYGKSVEAGDVRDDAFFFAAWEAPATAGDAECMSPEVWKVANPSWGRTIHEEEMSQAAKRANKSIDDWERFKMYRLNRWSNAENLWLRASDWKECRADFDAEQLQGSLCYGGLDLARTHDTTAFSLIFPRDDDYAVLTWFWIPEDTVRERAETGVPYRQWVHDGSLIATPGSVCDYDEVLSGIKQVADLYNIQSIAFDPHFAEELTQRIENETGVKRVAFGQTIMNFAAPTAEFERLVISRQMKHFGNPVLTWQVGHTKIKTDANNNKRPVKQQSSKDGRTIDGVVASIMALALAMKNTHGQYTPSIYDEPGAMLIR